MDAIKSFFLWFSGGNPGYMPLWHCMNMDTPWVVATVLLDLTVASGYVFIALHWLRNERLLPDSPSKRAMGAIKNIFILCGLCGYVFIPIKMVWPAWRLYDIVLAILAFYTWRYVLGTQDLKVVYNELGRTSKLARELEASKADVQRRGNFLNAISHDLRTPLNGLTLRTSLAEMQLATDDKPGLEASLHDIRLGALRVCELLDALLDYAKIDRDHEVPHIETFMLAGLVDDVVRDTSPIAGQKGIEIVSKIPRDLIVSTDRMKIRRVLSNLVTNAVKFTAVGSVSLHAEWTAHDLEIHVLDTGAGIAPEKIDLVFHEFYQIGNDQRDQQKGFGMGLPIARQLVARLGGAIEVQSTVGKGSRFTILLPGAVGPAAASPNQPLRQSQGVPNPSNA